MDRLAALLTGILVQKLFQPNALRNMVPFLQLQVLIIDLDFYTNLCNHMCAMVLFELEKNPVLDSPWGLGMFSRDPWIPRIENEPSSSRCASRELSVNCHEIAGAIKIGCTKVALFYSPHVG